MYPKGRQKKLYELSKQFLNQADLLSPENIDALREAIVYHEWRYAVLNDPVVSDFEYDQLYKKLEAVEATHPTLIVPDSPTQRVSNSLSSDFPTVAHLIPMLSLDNSYNAEDLRDFDQRIHELAMLEEGADVSYVVEPKFDGGSIALVYENDRLVRGATRGNGTRGDDITNNMRALRSIPLTASFSDFNIKKVELRGEAIIRLDRFKKINKAREKAEKSLFANPRNAATGALRMKDPAETASRGLEAFIYQLGYAEDADGKEILKNIPTHHEGIEMLASLGFKVPTIERKRCKNIDEVIDFCLEWQDKREGYDYEIDGMVVKVNRLDIQEKCGYTSHHPRWAIAFKFKAKQATTKLLDVEFQVGKIGQITPVAKLDPVALAGVTVSSVSLHNEDFIQSKDLHLGDRVLVERAGDVIPYIVKALPELRDGSEVKIKYPTHCPSCKTELVQPEGEVAWRCENYACEAQVLRRLTHHVSKDAMNIDGFGEKYILRFNELGWLNTVADIYRLNYDEISELEGFGQRSADNLRAAIDTAKKNGIARLLYSFSIPHIGRSVSRKVAAEVKDIRDLKDWTEEQFVDLSDIGPKVAQELIAFFQKQENLDLLNELEQLGVNIKRLDSEVKQEAVLGGIFSGKTILFTGKLQIMSRTDAKARAVAVGAKPISAVSGNLDILVVGEKPGSKLKKANELGTVEVMTEEEFLEKIKL